MKKIELIPQEYTVEQAKDDNYFVIQDGKYYNKEVYDDFSKNVNAGIEGVLRIITLNENDDLIITDLHYENNKFKVVRDETRDKNNKDNFINAYNFDKIGIYEKKVYAYSGKLNKSTVNNKNKALYLFDIFE